MDENQPEELGGDVVRPLLPRIDYEHCASALKLDSLDALRQASDEPQLNDFENEDEQTAPPHVKGAARAWGAP